MEKPYNWLDGYVFLHSPNSWKSVCELWASDEVRYAGKLENDGNDPDRIVVFVDADTRDKDAQDKLTKRMDAVRKTANPSFASATSTLIGPNGPTRWSEKQKWGAFLRITASRGDGRSIFDWLDPNRSGAPYQQDVSYYGHALCSGDWHVLLELGADTKQALDPLIAQVTDNMASLGIASVIVNKQKNHIYAPPRPINCVAWDGKGSNTD